MRENARTRLAALREKKPRTKSAQVRALWPEIKAVLDKGHSLKTVCDCLEADGIAITVQTLGSYITRIRKRALPIEVGSEQRVEEGAKSERRDAPPVASNAKAAKPSDPLANVRDRLGKRSGFDYRPELADAKDLI
jgi:hypothetical protein